MSQKQYRISKGEGKAMIALGVFFDILPILLIIITVTIALTLSTDLASVVGHAKGSSLNVENIGGFHPFGFFKRVYNDVMLTKHFLSGTTATAFTAVVIGPYIYTIGSWLSSFFAYVIFTVWFGLRKVNIWSLSKPKKLLTTILSVTIENIPLIDFLPGTTLMVWRHIQVSRTEDKLQLAKTKSTSLNRGSRAPRWQKAQSVAQSA